MKKSIKFNLLALFIASLLIVLTFGVIINNTYLESHYIAKDQFRLAELADEIIVAINEKDLELIADIEYDAKVSVAIIDKRFNPIFGHRHIDVEIYREIRENDKFPLYKLIDGHDTMLVYAVEFPEGYVVLLSPLDIIQNSIQITNDFHFITAILAILIGSSFTFLFSKQFTKPIIEMSEISLSMANLDFSNKIEYNSENELGMLANSINSLSQNLEKNINHLNDQVEFQKVLSRNISHELKTPVAVIKGYVEGLYYGIADTDEMKEQYYKIVINECDRMSNLISEMLSFSKISATQFELKDLNDINTFDIKEEIINIFGATIERQEIEFTMDIEEFYFTGDNGTIVRIISNFISNAIKYGDNKEMSLTIKRENNNVMIVVYNTGELIEASHLSRVFDAFYTLDAARTRERNGHGLGLAIVKSIADLYSGKVDVRNKGNGVEFSFVFPQNLNIT